MTGFDEARAWVRENAPDWIVARMDQTLEAAPVVGGSTYARYEVQLVEDSARIKAALDFGYVTLTGTGSTPLEAVQNAVGGLR